MNVVKWLYELAVTLKDSMSGVYEFLVTEHNFFGITFQNYEALFGSVLFVIIGYGVVSFIIDILP